MNLMKTLRSIRGAFEAPVYFANARPDAAQVWKSRKRDLSGTADDASEAAHIATAQAEHGGPKDHLKAAAAHYEAAEACDGLAKECGGQSDDDDADRYKGQGVAHQAMAKWHAAKANGQDAGMPGQPPPMPPGRGQRSQGQAVANEWSDEAREAAAAARKAKDRAVGASATAEDRSKKASETGLYAHHIDAAEAHLHAAAMHGANDDPESTKAFKYHLGKEREHVNAAMKTSGEKFPTREAGWDESHANERTTKALAAARTRLHLANEISFEDLKDDLRRLLADNPAFRPVAMPGAGIGGSSVPCGVSSWVRDVLAPENDLEDWTAIVSVGDKLFKVTFELDEDGEPELTDAPPVEVEADTMYRPINGGPAIMPDAGMAQPGDGLGNELDREVENDLANAGTSEGAAKGWETRKGGGVIDHGKGDEHMASAGKAQAQLKNIGEGDPAQHEASARSTTAHTMSALAYHRGAAMENGHEKAAQFHDAAAAAHKAAGNEDQAAKHTAIAAEHRTVATGQKVEQAYHVGTSADKASAAIGANPKINTPGEHEAVAKFHDAAAAAHLASGGPDAKAQAEYHQSAADGHRTKAKSHDVIENAHRQHQIENGTANEVPALANEGAMAWQVTEFANVASEEKDGDNWYQLAPYGKFPHTDGMQVFFKPDAENIVNEFNSLGNIVRRKIGLGWLIGHPDHPTFANKYTDQRAYGRIKELDARDDGLWGRVVWSKAGKEMVNEGAWAGHSVNWRVRKDKDGFHPVSLKSVGWTQEPNIPVQPVTHANEATPVAGPDLAAVRATLAEAALLANSDPMEAEVENDLANTWSDAAREAAAEARKAGGGTHVDPDKLQGKEYADYLSGSAKELSDKAASEGTAQSHGDAMGRHGAAAMAHGNLGDRATMAFHQAKAQEHQDKVGELLEPNPHKVTVSHMVTPTDKREFTVTTANKDEAHHTANLFKKSGASTTIAPVTPSAAA